MAKSEQHGTQGSMWLKHFWEETSSGHVETYDDLRLESSKDGENVILVKECGEKQFVKTASSDFKVEKYSISATELARLIVQYGHKV